MDNFGQLATDPTPDSSYNFFVGIWAITLLEVLECHQNIPQ